jgi:hypothetical protein
MIETLPSIRLIQEAEGREYAEIAVTEYSFLWLATLFPHLRTEPNVPFNQTTPTEGEINATAKRRAEGSFTSLATAALVSGRHGHGLDRYYLKYTCDRVLLATLVWRMLLRRILVCYSSHQ